MTNVTDINNKRRVRKIKQFFDTYKVDIIVFGSAAIVSGVGLGIMVYGLRGLAQTMKGLPTITNEGIKSTYALGGPNSPMTYELTEEVAAAYNRAGKSIEKAKQVGKTLIVKADDFDMSAWNYVAKMTNDYIAANGQIPIDNIFNHYLTKI